MDNDKVLTGQCKAHEGKPTDNDRILRIMKTTLSIPRSLPKTCQVHFNKQRNSYKLHLHFQGRVEVEEFLNLSILSNTTVSTHVEKPGCCHVEKILPL